MKKLILFLVFSIAIFSSYALDYTNSPKAQTKTVNWKPIIEFIYKGKKAYVNESSRIFKTGDHKKYSYAELLVSSDTTMPITLKDKKIYPKGIVRAFLAECKSGEIVPIYDLYFDVSYPSLESKAIGVFKYDSGNNSPVFISKNSILYRAMCPINI